jgi:hypothetical protein
MKTKEIIETLKQYGADDINSMLLTLCNGQYLESKSWTQEEVEEAHNYLTETIGNCEIKILHEMSLPYNYAYVDGNNGYSHYPETDEFKENFKNQVLSLAWQEVTNAQS